MSADIIMVKLPKAGSMAQAVQWISVPEASKILGVSRWTVIRSVKSGAIKGRRVSAKRFQVDASSLAGA